MKNNLLIAARTSHYFDNRAFRLAGESLNAAEISARLGVLSRRIAAIRKTFHHLRWLTFLAVAIAVFAKCYSDSSQAQRADPTTWVFFLMAAIILATVGTVPLVAVQAMLHHFWANTSEQELLQPMAGTIQCEYSLEDLKTGGERVAQWRDLAVTERGQLHGFDGYIMSALRDVHQSETVRNARQAEVDSACRQLHGLEPLVTQESPALEPTEAA